MRRIIQAAVRRCASCVYIYVVSSAGRVAPDNTVVQGDGVTRKQNGDSSQGGCLVAGEGAIDEAGQPLGAIDAIPVGRLVAGKGAVDEGGANESRIEVSEATARGTARVSLIADYSKVRKGHRNGPVGRDSPPIECMITKKKAAVEVQRLTFGKNRPTKLDRRIVTEFIARKSRVGRGIDVNGAT